MNMKKILLIEDDPILREVTAEFLRRENFQTFLAKDGLMGIKQTLQHLPDLILCDISMPNLNGIDFYKTIQQIKITSTIPLIFLTARTEKEDIRTGMGLGADDYITKPFDYFDLLEVIKLRLAKHEKILEYNDEKFNALAENPSMGVYIYQNDHFVFFNQTLCSFFGHSRENFAKLKFSNLVEEKCRKGIIKEVEKCLAGFHKNLSVRFEAIHRTGDLIDIEMYGNVANYLGGPSIIGNIRIADKASVETLIEKRNVNNAEILSRREMDVVKLICKGLSTHEVAETLHISQRTVDSHRSVILLKTGCRNIAELVLFAVRNQIVLPKPNL